MVAVNPDPHAKGYQFSPLHRVRGVFASANRLGDVLRSLSNAGFAGKDIEVYVGDEGVKMLDSTGKHHGILIRLLRDLDSTFFANDTEYHTKVDSLLQSGGCAVDVIVGDDADKKLLAGQLMKSNHAEEVVYWGRLLVEWL